MNFDDIPAVGQRYDFAGKSWVYNGKGWARVAPSAAGVLTQSYRVGYGHRPITLSVQKYQRAPILYNPTWANVGSLLHFDGANDSTTFTDQKGKVWTAAADAKIKTAQSVFGGASGLFDGAGDRISTPMHADFEFGSGDFCIALSLYPTAHKSAYVVVPLITSSAYCPWTIFQVSSQLQFYASSSNTSWDVVAAMLMGTLTLNQWNHFIVNRRSGTIRTYKDYALVSTVSAPGTIATIADPMHVGAAGDGLFAFEGYIDELLIVKSEAVYPALSSFDPRTVPYPNS
jgi:hypothetical protein